MEILINLLIYSLAVYITAKILPGVTVKDFSTAVAVTVILGVVNAFVKPAFIFLTLPVTILTFGLFAFIINALMILLTDAIVPGFEVRNFWWAIGFSFFLSLVSSVIFSLTK